jgi:DNA repair exonuclease SbcCD ATPase subunit
MITLKRLHANNFKGLREVTLHFPEQGSVLIEGHNEAGKSTLFEAVYVGLYGKPLVGEDERARLVEVIQYGQSRATVELVVSIGQQLLTITRIFERGRSQHATLTLQQPGMPPEVVNRVTAVNERILKELGNLDGESLRNSCFVEQKELGRIEELNCSDREQAIRKLLGLERLTKLMDEFKCKCEQERELAQAEKLLTLAHLQDEIQAALIKETQLSERLDAVKVVSQLNNLADLAVEKEAIEKRQGELTSGIQQAQVCLDRCNEIEEQITRCNPAAHSLTEVLHVRRELNHSKAESARLEQIEMIDLPAAQQHLADMTNLAKAVMQMTHTRSRVQEAKVDVREVQHLLKQLQRAEDDQRQKAEEVSVAYQRLEQRKQNATLEQQQIAQQLNDLETKKNCLERLLDLIGQWEAARDRLSALQQEIHATEARQKEQLKLQSELQQREERLRGLQEAVDQAEQEQQKATHQYQLATAYEELTAWLRLKGVEATLREYATRHSEFLTQRQTAEATLLIEQKKSRTLLLASLTLAVLAVLALLIGLIWLPAVLLFICFAGLSAIAAWIWLSGMRKNLQQYSNERDHWITELQRLEIERQAATKAGGDPARLSYHEHQIQQANVEIPSSLSTGQRLLEDVKRKLGQTDFYRAQEVAQSARDNHIRLSEQIKQAQSDVEESRKRLTVIQQAGDPTEHLETLLAQVAAQERRVVQAEQDAREALPVDMRWPTTSHEVQAALSACLAERRSLENTQKQQETNTARLLLEAQADLEKAQYALRRAQGNVDHQRAKDPVTQVSRAQEILAEVQTVCAQQEEMVRQLLKKADLYSEMDVEPERGRAEVRVQKLAEELATRPERMKNCEALTGDFVQKVSIVATLIEDLISVGHRLSITELPLFSQEIEYDSSFPYEQEWLTTLTNIKDAFQKSLVDLDEAGTRSRRENALSEQGRLQQQVSRLDVQASESKQQTVSLFAKYNLIAPGAYTWEQVIESWPLVASVAAEEEVQVTQELEDVKRQLYATRQQENALAKELLYAGPPLNVADCQQKVNELLEEREICLRANDLLREVHERIARRVLPITERNMQPILQQLTGGRYRDVRLTPEDTNGQSGEMDYRIRVWDSVAGRFVAKNIFSGGTRDQCSLALRLAFALATLPQELGVAPGFIFLDEPLSAFDAQRARALVDLLTTGTIAQQFSQVVLISHHHAFEREAFRYHVRMESGQIVESDLPSQEDEISR